MQKTMDSAAAEGAVARSTYATILVHAESGQGSSHRVEVAARLARDLDARLIGLGAETFDTALFSGPITGFAAGEWITMVQDGLNKSLAAAEGAFRRNAAGAETEWRTLQDYPDRALASTSYAADLVVVSPRSERSNQQAADPAEVVMTAGRPVLIAPEDRSRLVGRKVVVAWKNTQECRRALADALPFLQRADEVIVLAVTKPDVADVAASESEDVVANLKRHGVEARALITSIDNAAIEDEIERVANVYGADLIVAGAYGHSRLREWAFGGVTESFLRHPRYFVLMSH